MRVAMSDYALLHTILACVRDAAIADASFAGASSSPLRRHMLTRERGLMFEVRHVIYRVSLHYAATEVSTSFFLRDAERFYKMAVPRFSSYFFFFFFFFFFF